MHDEQRDALDEMAIKTLKELRQVRDDWKTQSQLWEAEAVRLREALDECEEYFEGRADAEYFTDNPAPHPNEEMKLLCIVRRAKGDA